MMRCLIHLFVVISLCLLLIPQQGFAKTYAYFIGPQGKIAKLDTDTNLVTQLTLKKPAGATLDKILGANIATNHIYITHCIRLGPCKVGVYGLKTLNFIKELPLESLDPDIQMLIYPDGSKFLIQYFTPGEGDEKGGYTTDLYDAKTISQIKNLQTIFAMGKVMFSPDGKKMYSVVGGDDARVDIIDSSTFEVLASRDLAKTWRKEGEEIFCAVVEDFKAGKVLISEDLKAERSLPDKLDFYVYTIETGTVSSRTSTGMQGKLVLTSDGSKIIFDENEDIIEMFGTSRQIMGFKSLGRLHIYDVSTGNKLGSVSFQVKGEGEIAGIRPVGDRLYYESEGDKAETSKITVLNIKDYSVVTSFLLPFKVLFTVFFEE